MTAGEKISTLLLMLACWPVAKSHMANCFILQKENVFCMTFGLAIGQLTCTFHSIKVSSSNTYLIYLCIILCIIILPFNWTTITVKIVSKVISDITGSCCRSISLPCKILKGIIMYFSPVIHNISMDCIIRQSQDIVEYYSCLNYCSYIVRI